MVHQIIEVSKSWCLAVRQGNEKTKKSMRAETRQRRQKEENSLLFSSLDGPKTADLGDDFSLSLESQLRDFPLSCQYRDGIALSSEQQHLTVG